MVAFLVQRVRLLRLHGIDISLLRWKWRHLVFGSWKRDYSRLRWWVRVSGPVLTAAALGFAHLSLPADAQTSSELSEGPGSSIVRSIHSSADLTIQLTLSKRSVSDSLTSSFDGSYPERIRQLLAEVIYFSASSLSASEVVGPFQLALLGEPSLLGAECEPNAVMSEIRELRSNKPQIPQETREAFRDLVKALSETIDPAVSLSDDPLALLYEIGVLAKRPEFQGLARRVTDALWTCSGEVEPGARSVRGMALALHAQLSQERQFIFADRQVTPEEPERLTLLQQERRLYPRYKQSAQVGEASGPRLCLAMSGGGIRSAAFQVGVLQALADRGDLQDLDVVSAVSGGSYALSWYLNSLSWQAGWRPGDNPLDERFVRHLDRDAGRLVTLPEAIFLGVANVLSAPLSRIALEPASARPLTYSLSHLNYGHLISEAFRTPNYSLSSLRQVLSDQPRMPFPIFASTARSEDEGPCGADLTPRNLAEQVFELTPTASGSAARGFSSAYGESITVRSASAISGSAIDTPYRSFCARMERLGLKLGARLQFTVGNEEVGVLYLSDGAFSDNLGVFPLLRRECSEILVADAEEDPDLAYASYTRLKEALANSVTIEIEGIDTALSEPHAHVRDPALGSEEAAAASHCGQAFVASRRAKQAAFPGFASVHANGEGALPEKVPVTYLKLAVDECQGDLPDTVREILAEGREAPRRGFLPSKAAQFPHIPTSNQNLGERYFRALRHLGFHVTCLARGGERDHCQRGPLFDRSSVTGVPPREGRLWGPWEEERSYVYDQVASSTAAAVLADSLRLCSAAGWDEHLVADVAQLSALVLHTPWEQLGVQEMPQHPSASLDFLLAVLDSFSSDPSKVAEREEIGALLGELALRPVCTRQSDGTMSPPNAEALKNAYWATKDTVHEVVSRRPRVLMSNDDRAYYEWARHRNLERMNAVAFVDAKSMLDNAETPNQMRQIMLSPDFLQSMFDISELAEQLGTGGALSTLNRCHFERWAASGRRALYPQPSR